LYYAYKWNVNVNIKMSSSDYKLRRALLHEIETYRSIHQDRRATWEFPKTQLYRNTREIVYEGSSNHTSSEKKRPRDSQGLFLLTYAGRIRMPLVNFQGSSDEEQACPRCITFQLGFLQHMLNDHHQGYGPTYTCIAKGTIINKQ
jgi:hypothetical protein